MSTEYQKDIPATARAALLTAIPSPLTISSTYPVPQPSSLKAGECLIKLEYSGVCHSDVHVRNGDWGSKASMPLVGGHEGVGHIIAIGEGSAEGPGTVKVGDRVGAKWIANACLRCEMCRKGNESSCQLSFTKVHGFTLNGTFAEYMVSFVDYVTPIPDALSSPDAAPILCAGLTSYKALKQSGATAGQWVAISGAGGGLGHLAIQYATNMGLRALAIDAAGKKDLCMRLGAEEFVDFTQFGDNDEDLVKAVQSKTDGGPVAAIIAVGHPKPFNQALAYLGMKGVLVAVGMGSGSLTMQVPISLLIAKSLQIIGSAIGNRQDAIEALDIAARGKVKCVYTIKRLEDVNEVLDDLQLGKVEGRIVLKI